MSDNLPAKTKQVRGSTSVVRVLLCTTLVVPCSKSREVQQGDSEAGGKCRGTQLP